MKNLLLKKSYKIQNFMPTKIITDEEKSITWKKLLQDSKIFLRK